MLQRKSSTAIPRFLTVFISLVKKTKVYGWTIIISFSFATYTFCLSLNPSPLSLSRSRLNKISTPLTSILSLFLNFTISPSCSALSLSFTHTHTHHHHHHHHHRANSSLPFIWKKFMFSIVWMQGVLSKVNSNSGDTRGASSISLLKLMSAMDTRLIRPGDTCKHSRVE